MEESRKDDYVIAFAIALYEADGYPENSFEMLSYEMSNKYCRKAQNLMDKGYTRTSPSNFLEMVEPCVHCWGGFRVPINSCSICSGKGVILKEREKTNG